MISIGLGAIQLMIYPYPRDKTKVIQKILYLGFLMNLPGDFYHLSKLFPTSLHLFDNNWTIVENKKTGCQHNPFFFGVVSLEAFKRTTHRNVSLYPVN